MPENFTEKTIRSTEIFQGKIIRVTLDDVLLPNGKKNRRELVKHPGAAAILALTSEGKIVMVRQFRKPLERTLVEIPAGKLEEGEQPEESIVRELEEETGYRAEKVEYVTSFYTSPGFADEIIHLYFCQSLHRGTVQTDDDEFVECLEVTFEEAEAMIQKREIYDAKTLIALQYLKLKRLEGEEV